MPRPQPCSSELGAARRAVDVHFQRKEWRAALDALDALLRGGAGTTADVVRRARILCNMRRHAEALAQLRALAKVTGQTYDVATLLKICHFNLGDVAKAIVCGQTAIARRDRDCSAAAAPVAIAPRPEGKDVIAFSLWGARDAYCLGAVINAGLCRCIYPGWTARFYVGPDVPAETLAMLANAGAEIVPGEPRIPRYFWRFMVMNDPGVRRFLCRDTDARPSGREAALVGEWIESGRAFHVIRDHVLHSDLILAGMWGGHATDAIDLRALVNPCAERYGDDQEFLAREIWPRVKGSILVHDLHYATPPIPSIRRPGRGTGSIGAGLQSDDEVRREWARLNGQPFAITGKLRGHAAERSDMPHIE